jgi:RNA polymerase sigma-70 factor (ECF subfamily)
MDAGAGRAQVDSFAAAVRDHGGYLRRVATRLLGDPEAAEDTVQEAYARLAQTDLVAIGDMRGWLAVVVRRLSIDHLRHAYVRRESTAPVFPGDDIPEAGLAPDPADRITLDNEVQLALGVVLDELSPPERTAFVLHDVFAVPFDEIAAIVGRSSAAARQLASRARRRVQGTVATPGRDRARDRAVVSAFLAAARGGDLDTLILLLDPDAVLTVDEAAAARGSFTGTHGADRVARTFTERPLGARPALIDGEVGLAWAPEGQVRAVFTFTVVEDTITAIRLVTDARVIAALHVAFLGE